MPRISEGKPFPVLGGTPEGWVGTSVGETAAGVGASVGTDADVGVGSRVATGRGSSDGAIGVVEAGGVLAQAATRTATRKIPQTPRIESTPLVLRATHCAPRAHSLAGGLGERLTRRVVNE